jgi:hypothetical protein
VAALLFGAPTACTSSLMQFRIRAAAGRSRDALLLAAFAFVPYVSGLSMKLVQALLPSLYAFVRANGLPLRCA